MNETRIHNIEEITEQTNHIIHSFICAYQKMDPSESCHLRHALIHALNQIADLFTTAAYSFNLAIDLFVEKTSPLIEKPLQDILESEIPNEYSMFFYHSDYNALFCAYYALSLIYKKQNRFDDLQRLLDNFGEEYERSSKYDVFSSYPLYHEVRSRCYKRLGKLETALEQDKNALDLLNAYNIDNCAIGNSYASTVSMILANKQYISPDKVAKAHEYIEKAINYNPSYPKYYFVKAQLLYYSALQDNMDVYLFEAVCNEAIQLVENGAFVKLHQLYNGNHAHSSAEKRKYNDFRSKIEKERDRRLREASEEAARLKEQILNCSAYRDCPRPKMPALADDTPYFYICYSTLDYKSVFCDLVELYHQRIPFKYDECLTAGQGWNPQVEAFIANKCCLGVVFYISKNTLISESFCHEIEMVCEKMKKPYFAVNLEGDEPPSRILIDTILDVCKKGKKPPISGDQIRPFTLAFPDNMVFTPKFRRDKDDGTKHFSNYKMQLKQQFGMVFDLHSISKRSLYEHNVSSLRL